MKKLLLYLLFVINLSAADNLSGVKLVVYSVNNGECWEGKEVIL